MNARRAAVAALLVLSFGVGGTLWWRDGGKRLFQPRNFHVSEPGFLYRSGQIHRRLIEDVLREHRIDLVIDLARDKQGDLDAEAEREAIASLGIERLALPLRGTGAGPAADYASALMAIDRAHREGRRVLIHCTAGAERTGGMIALYRTLFEGWSDADARAEYLAHRSEPRRWSPVPQYVDAHVGEIAAELVARGALSSVPSPLPVLALPRSSAR